MRPVGLLREDTLGHERMEMRVHVQRRPAALNRRDRPGAAPNPQPARPALLETEQRPHEHPQHGAAEAVVVSQPIAEPKWERQHPLANRQAAEYAVDQVRGALAHAPAAARPADVPLARKCDENLSRTAVTPESRKASRHRATGQELAQVPFHEARQPLPAAARARLGEKGLEVLAHHAVQDGLLGLAAHVGLPPTAALSRVCARTAGRPRPPGGETLCDRIHRHRARRPCGVSTNDG
jgi:hypothetical protein